MKHLYLFLMLALLISCNGKKTTENSKPLKIIVAIDFDSERINENLIKRDTIIMNYVFKYFTDLQSNKEFESRDKIIVVSLNATENNIMFSLEMENINGFYGLQDDIYSIKSNIIKEYEKHNKSDFYTFFKNELPIYIEDGYRNKLIIVSNGTSIIKDEELKTTYRTFIPKSDYLRAFSDKNWATSGIINEIELEPVNVANSSNLEILMPALSSIKQDLNENELLKTIWERWFSKLGFNYTIKLASNNVLTYEKTIKEFLEQENQPVTFTDGKKRPKNYIISILPNKEIVDGYVGNYYILDITSIKTNKPIGFHSGKYFINSFAEEFDTPTLEFKKEIIDIKNKSSSNDRFRVFVKGSADITGDKTFKSNLNATYPYNKIHYLKKINNSEYKYNSSEQGITQIKDIFTNSELPNLRAEFIKIFLEKYQIDELFGEIDILDGSIGQDTTFRGRNVKIILYSTTKIN